MGHYLQAPSHHNKADHFMQVHGAEPCDQVLQMADVPDGKMAVCVVDNGPFEAALVCYKQSELDEVNVFSTPATGDHRPRTWLLMDREKIAELNPNVPMDEG